MSVAHILTSILISICIRTRSKALFFSSTCASTDRNRNADATTIVLVLAIAVVGFSDWKFASAKNSGTIPSVPLTSQRYVSLTFVKNTQL